MASGGDLQGDLLTSMDIDLFPIEKSRGPYAYPKNGSLALNIRIKFSKFSLQSLFHARKHSHQSKILHNSFFHPFVHNIPFIIYTLCLRSLNCRLHKLN